MEDSVQRRLDCVSRHLLPPLEACSLIHPVELRGDGAEEGEAGPVVIGGMVLDIHAIPSIPPAPRTTTPGKVHYILGGVARNVAECISKLGTKPYMISALGNDMAGNLLLQHWKSAGLSTKGIRKHRDIWTPVICNILDTYGELAAAVASLEAIEKFLTPEWIKQSEHSVCTAPILMVDANLVPVALAASCQVAAKSNVPVWFEPVSVVKSRRITSIVQHVTFASPNEDELIAMANTLTYGDTFSPLERNDDKNFSMESLFQMLKPAVLVLLERGIKIVAVTLGVNGLLLCSRGPKSMEISLERTRRCGFSGRLHDLVTSSCPSSRFSGSIPMLTERMPNFFAIHFPALPASVVRLTGAGDCFVGGTLASLCSGLDLLQSVAVGIAVAKAAVEAETNVPPEFRLAAIADDAKLVYSMAKVLS